MRKIVVISLLFLLFSFPKNVFAVSITINTHPDTISSSDQFTVNVSISGADAGKNYLRIQLYKEGTTKYFGETYNGSTWYRDSDGTQYFPIDITSGTTWTGDVQGRFGSPSPSEYDGQGTYKMRIQRYTSSGSLGSEDENSSAVTQTITVPTPSPSPSPTPTPTKSPTPSPTPTPTKAPTPTPTPTKTPTPTPATSSKNTPTPLPTVDPNREGGTESAVFDQPVQGHESILGNSTGFNNMQSGISDDNNSYSWGKLFILMGVVLVGGACGILLYNNYRKQKESSITSQ